MSILALCFLLALQDKPAPPSEPKPIAPQVEPAKQETTPKPTPQPAPEQPLSFFSENLPYHWNQTIPLTINVDGLKVTSISFARREPKTKFLQGPDYGSRALIEVTNTAAKPRTPGFAVAVFDKDGRLLGAANGGTKIGTVKPGGTETFELSFFQVKERLPRGDHYVLSVELRD